MNNEPPSSKHIVSKGKYAVALAKKVILGAVSICVIMIGLLLFTAMTRMLANTHNRVDGQSAVLAIGFCVCAGLAGYLGTCLFEKAERLNSGVPLTRANIADLPAPDSLVRASSQPAQAQETILLRASKETQEKHEEQLLRATAGEQE